MHSQERIWRSFWTAQSKPLSRDRKPRNSPAALGFREELHFFVGSPFLKLSCNNPAVPASPCMSHVPHNDQSEPTDGEDLPRLLAAVRAGDESAARLVVERLYAQVRKIVLAHLPRRDDPEDLMQEIFLKMFSRLEQFRGHVPFEHWVARLALTTCLDQLRRQRARPELRWADLSDDERTMLETVTASSEPADLDAPRALALFNHLLDRLPPTDAWLLRQVELEQQSLAEVCAATCWNGGVARIRLFRARRRLQALYRQLKKGRA